MDIAVVRATATAVQRAAFAFSERRLTAALKKCANLASLRLDGVWRFKRETGRTALALFGTRLNETGLKPYRLTPGGIRRAPA